MLRTDLVVGFDLDMTLVDSSEGIAATLAAAIRSVPGGELIPGPSPQAWRAEVWPWIGLPLEATVATLAPGLDQDLVVRRYRASYAEIGVPLTFLLPGALESFAAVRAAGGRVLVVSAKIEAGVRDVLAAVGLDRPEVLPDLIVGGLFGAAKADVLLAEGAQVYVGDHSGDVTAAKVAGAAAVAVCTGPQPAQTLAEAGAHVVLPDLTGFPRWLSTFSPGSSRPQATR